MYLLHIADIHLTSNEKRFHEYKLVLAQLELVINDPQIVGAIIAGDILDRPDINETSGKLLRDFIEMLVKCKKPVHMIPGNHDKPVIKSYLPNHTASNTAIQNTVTSGLTFYEKTTVTNITFASKSYSCVIVSGWDLASPERLNDLAQMVNFDGDLFCSHEDIKTYNAEYCKYYKSMLLGDIHNPYYNPLNVSNAHYSGSLIQQSIVEKPYGGYRVLDLSTFKSGYYELPNPYGSFCLYTLDQVKDALASNEKNKYPESAREIIVKLNEDLPINEYQGIREQLHAKFPSSAIFMHTAGTSTPEVTNLMELFFHQKNVHPSIADEVRKLYEIDSKQITPNSTSPPPNSSTHIYKKWQLDSIIARNFGIYESINFNLKPGITGIIAPNATGKSMIIDALSIVLYGEPVRGNLKNFSNKNYEIEANLVVDDEKVQIHKTQMGTKSINSSTSLSPINSGAYISDKTSFISIMAQGTNIFAKKFLKDDLRSFMDLFGLSGYQVWINQIDVLRKSQKSVCDYIKKTINLFDDEGMLIQKIEETKSQIAKCTSSNQQNMQTVSSMQNMQNYQKKFNMTFSQAQSILQEDIIDTLENAANQQNRIRELQITANQFGRFSFADECKCCDQNRKMIALPKGKNVSEWIDELKDLHDKSNIYYKYIEDQTRKRHEATLVVEQGDDQNVDENNASALIPLARTLADLELRLSNYYRVKTEFTKMTVYDTYHHLMEFIPFAITSELIKSLNLEINNVLSIISDFRVSINIIKSSAATKGDEFEILILPSIILGKPVSITCGSGAQMFLTAIAFRVALLSVIQQPYGDFLIIDEGFSCLDKEHQEKIPLLLEYLKTKFRSILIISHLESVQKHIEHIYVINTNIAGNTLGDPVEMSKHKHEHEKQEHEKSDTKHTQDSISYKCECCPRAFKNKVTHANGKTHQKNVETFIRKHGRSPTIS